MTEQRFPAGPEPRVRIGVVQGDLRVEAWDEETLLVRADEPGEVYQENDEVVIDRARDLVIRAPARTTIAVEVCHGDATLTGLRQAALTRVHGELRATALTTAQVEHVGGDARVANPGERFSAASIAGYLKVIAASDATVAVGSVGDDLSVNGTLGMLQVGQVGGDGDLDGACARVELGHVGGDLRLVRVNELRVGSVGGDLEVGQALGQVEIGNVGGDAELISFEGTLTLANVAGDLVLRGSFGPNNRTRTLVGGDARVTLTGEPDLTLTAVVAGAVRGVVGGDGDGRKRLNLRYGAGSASLDLTVSGDLRIDAPRPDSRSARVEAGFSEEFDRDWAEFRSDLGELGRELGRLGSEIGARIAATLSGEGVAGGAAWAEDLAREVQEKARELQARAERHARKMEERARRAEEKARVRVRINEREWQFDPERLERIKEQARRAAGEGLAGALEAVERALSRLRVPPDVPSPPGAPPPPPPPRPPVTGQTIRIETPPEPASPADIERERETILRMVAEGRISPEEGDLLLEALG
ncbi:MAG: hypothetical protein SNJ69_06990 [Chloroflexaceae bacterium]